MTYEPEHRDPYALALKIALGAAIVIICTAMAWPFFATVLAVIRFGATP
jgi:hypothetical protein